MRHCFVLSDWRMKHKSLKSKGNWRKELAQMRSNILSERKKLGSRTDRNYVNAMRQLRRNPTAVSDKFKNAMEELKKNAEVK